MAIPVLSWRGAVLKSGLPSTTRHVLLTLGCHMNDAGESCYPSIEMLCDETGLSNRSVLTHLKVASDAGWIEVEKHGFAGRKWARNEYKISYPRSFFDDQQGSEGGSLPHVKAVNLLPQGSELGDVKAVKEVHTNSSSNSSENSPPEFAASAAIEKQNNQIGWDDPDQMFKGISAEKMAAWEKAFPGFDVEGELNRIDLWYARKLTESPRFKWKNAERGIHGWLSRAFNESRRPRFAPKQQAQQPYQQAR